MYILILIVLNCSASQCDNSLSIIIQFENNFLLKLKFSYRSSVLFEISFWTAKTSLLYFSLLFYTLLYFTLLYFTLLYFTLLYCTVLFLSIYSELLHVCHNDINYINRTILLSLSTELLWY